MYKNNVYKNNVYKNNVYKNNVYIKYKIFCFIMINVKFIFY